MLFAWDEWNCDHIAKHGVTPAEAEHVVRNASAPFPREIGEQKYLIWGQSDTRRNLQIVFVLRSSEGIDYGSLTLADLLSLSDDDDATVVYIIHAMPMTPRMLRQYRRLQR